MTHKPRRKISVGLGETLSKRLDREEEAAGLSTSDIIRVALDQYLTAQEEKRNVH